MADDFPFHNSGSDCFVTAVVQAIRVPSALKTLIDRTIDTHIQPSPHDTAACVFCSLKATFVTKIIKGRDEGGSVVELRRLLHTLEQKEIQAQADPKNVGIPAAGLGDVFSVLATILERFPHTREKLVLKSTLHTPIFALYQQETPSCVTQAEMQSWIETGYTPIEIDVSKGWFCLQIKSYLVRDIRDPSRIYIPHDIDGTFFSSVINGYFAYAVIIDQGGHFITYTRITHDSFWTKLDDIRLSRTRSYEIPKNDSDRACFVLYKCTDESARVPHQLSKSFRLIQAPSEQPFDAPTDMNPGFLSITAYHNLSLNGCFMCVCLQAFQVPTTLINQVAQGIFLLHESTHPKRVIDCILCILKDSVNKRGPYGENQPVNFRTPGRKGEIDYPSSGDYALLRTKLHVIEPTNIPLDEEGDMIVTLMILIDIIDPTKTTLGVKSQTIIKPTGYLKHFRQDVITDNKPQFVFDVSKIEYRAQSIRDMLNTYFSADGSISCIIDKNSSGLLYKENGWTCQNIKDLQIETDDKKKPGRITSIIFKSTDETRFTHLRFAAELSHGWFLYDNGVITFCGISIDWIDTFDGKLICLFFDFLDQTPSLFILSPKAPPPPVAPKPVSSLHSFVFSCLDKPTTA